VEIATYLLLVLRPYYASKLLAEIIRKTTVPYEVVVWMNCENPDFEKHLAHLTAQGAPIRLVGKTPENIGMAAFRPMIAESAGDMLVQLDDDVIMISRRAVEIAREALAARKDLGMVVASVWQDEYTSGAHGRPCDYVLKDESLCLYEGNIDGGLTFYPRESLGALMKCSFAKYGGLGAETLYHLGLEGKVGYLSRRIKMFHLHGPVYHWYFNHLEEEIQKYRAVGLNATADVYERHSGYPQRQKLAEKLKEIEAHFDSFDGTLVKP